jgi:nitrile hydratase accessory protein
VFAAPWQAQVFALTVELHAQGAFSWPEWTNALGAQLAAAGPEDDGSQYYEHWLSALERLVVAKQLAATAALGKRKLAWAAAYLRTPHGQPVSLEDEWKA